MIGLCVWGSGVQSPFAAVTVVILEEITRPADDLETRDG